MGWSDSFGSVPSRSFRGATAACFALAGCAGVPHGVESPEPRPLGAGFPAYAVPPMAEQGPPSTRGDADPTGPITLSGALALGLERSPELASFAWEVRAREARALQAGFRPNPELALQIEEFGGTGEVSSFMGRSPLCW